MFVLLRNNLVFGNLQSTPSAIIILRKEAAARIIILRKEAAARIKYLWSNTLSTNVCPVIRKSLVFGNSLKYKEAAASIVPIFSQKAADISFKNLKAAENK